MNLMSSIAKTLVGSPIAMVNVAPVLFTGRTPYLRATSPGTILMTAGSIEKLERSIEGTPNCWESVSVMSLSETAPTLTCNRADIAEFSGTIGLPVPSTYISIRDDDGNEVPLGQPGEICAKGPQVMAGYWNRPDETANVMTADGFFRTGDIGVMDERGFAKIVDRKKDMILVSGFNVYPNEIEEVIASHAGVLECAVIGVADAKSGEAVKAFIVKKDPNLTAEDVIKFCGTQLTGYKVPKQIEFRTDLPKTNVGKILRRELRDEKKAAA